VNRRVGAVIVAAIVCATNAANAARRDPAEAYPTETTRSYRDLGYKGVWLDTMRLSATFASFKALRGHMDLEFVTELQVPGTRFPMRIYRILNAETFFTASNRNILHLRILPRGRIPTYLSAMPLEPYGFAPELKIFLSDFDGIPTDVNEYRRHNVLGLAPYGLATAP
jgi:hypothetical protein